MFLTLVLIAAIGLSISLYSYALEQKIKKEPDYKPICDINDTISCTKVINSEYANLLYFSNSSIGIAYYLFIIVLGILEETTLLVGASIGGLIGSAALAYILFFKIKTYCPLCIFLYIVNIAIFLLGMVFAQGSYT